MASSRLPRSASGFYYNFLITAMTWILVKLLYLWLAFFQFHLCYVSQTKKNTGFLKVNLTCSYSWVSIRRPPSLRLLIVWYFSTQDILISIPPPINYWITFPAFETIYLCWHICNLTKGTARLYCEFLVKKPTHFVSFCKLV